MNAKLYQLETQRILDLVVKIQGWRNENKMDTF